MSKKVEKKIALAHYKQHPQSGPAPMSLHAPVAAAAAAPAAAAAAAPAAHFAASVDNINRKAHTLILYQRDADSRSRMYKDFDTVDKAMDGVCQLFEEKLKHDRPGEKKITYDISDLYSYIDSMADMCALVFDGRTAQYAPFPKVWIKESVLAHLKRAAQGLD